MFALLQLEHTSFNNIHKFYFNQKFLHTFQYYIQLYTRNTVTRSKPKKKKKCDPS